MIIRIPLPLHAGGEASLVRFFFPLSFFGMLQCVAQCVAVCCRVLQRMIILIPLSLHAGGDASLVRAFFSCMYGTTLLL